MKLKFWAALFLFAATSFNVRADELTGQLNMVQIDGLDVEKLESLQVELNTHILAAKQISERVSTPLFIDPTFLVLLGTFPVQESADTLLEVINSELGRAGTPEFVSQLLAIAATSLGQIATKSPSRHLNTLKRLLQAVAQDTSGFAQHLAQVIQEVEKRTHSLPALNKIIEHKRTEEAEAKRTPQEKLDAIEKLLSGRVIGQPEVVQGLMDLEWRNALYGSRERTLPDVIYMMGLPGTGKDTAAESFTDALHGVEGAHEKHLFRVKPLKSQADSWKLLGSNTGFLGSDSFPPFLEFLVLHSDGKYKIEEEQNPMGKVVKKIVVNPEYKGKTLPGYFPPHKGVVFLNEFHNWSKQLKDDIVKEALEKGYFSVNSPNGGLAQINVPIRFMIASNEGIGLLTAREANGQRHGKPLTFEEVLRKWEKVAPNKAGLRNEILATNGSPNNKVEGDGQPGISEELLNRIPERFILMMRPLSPTDLQTIVKLALAKAVQRIQGSSDLMKDVKITWTDELVRLIQEYDYSAEDNARPVKDRIIGFVEEPLLDAVRAGKLDVKPGAEIRIGVAQNEDRTRRITVHITEEGSTREVSQLIRTTVKDVPAQPITDERIEHLAGLGEQLKGLVFGIDNIVERIAQRVVSIENDGASGQDRRATVLMLNGLSSTGKTELAKQLAKLLQRANGGAGGELKTFDFSQVQTLEDFKTKILGIRDGRGNPIPSDFMKHYDRNNGNIIVAFDELANVRDERLLTALYDFFREETVTTFSDGKPRKMGGVKVIITGNAGKEIYDRVPRHLPMAVQMAAWQDIYERANRDFDFQLTFLERSYPSPLLVRIGRNNIFFMPPHNYRSLRQLAQLKLDEAFKRIKDTNSRRGWEILLPSTQEYGKLIDTIIDEGFTLRNQGASIETFIRDDIEEPLKYQLLRNKIPSNAKVTIRYNHATDNTNEDVPGKVFFDLIVEGRGEPLSLEIKRPHVPKQLLPDKTNLIVTAYHEAGHSLAQHILYSGAVKSTKISIIPGVTLIGSEWIYYAGVAAWEQSKEIPQIREYFVRRIAIFAAGETAERLTTRGARDSAGKSNDMERATRVARDAIVKYGLSPNWGTNAIPEGVTVDAYIAGLSEEKKNLLERETEALVKEGRELAQLLLEQHLESHLVPLGNLLVEKGELNRQELEKFYADRQAQVVEPTTISTSRRAYLRYRTMYRHWTNRPSSPMALELLPSIAQPASVADLQKIAADRKAAQYASVPTPNAPFISEAPSAPRLSVVPGSIDAIVANARVKIRCMEAHLARAR